MGASTMRFWGGPLDGSEEQPNSGWPAPPVYKVQDSMGGFYIYERERVTDDGIHIYSYQRHEIPSTVADPQEPKP